MRVHKRKNVENLVENRILRLIYITASIFYKILKYLPSYYIKKKLKKQKSYIQISENQVNLIGYVARYFVYWI